MKNYKCIIFDCDGVLVDSEILGNQIFVDMANEYGADITIEYALENFKGSFFKDCVRQIEQIIGQPLPEDFERHYRQRSYDVFKRELQPVKGIEKVLKNLGVPFCTASSGPQEKIRFNLEVTGLLHFFEGNIFSCYDIGKWKPDPAIFIHVARKMGYAPQECLVIEDTVFGAMAAKRGNFDVFGFTPQNADNGLVDLCTLTFHDMEELVSMVKTAS